MARRPPSQHSSPANPNSDEKIASSGSIPIPQGHAKMGSPRADAETLLRALRNVIIPFVRPANGDHKHDANQDVLGADGEEFVTALQKFMLSFFRSQQGPVGGIEVEMEVEEGINISDAEAEETAEDDLSLHDVADVASEMESSPDRSVPEENASSEGLRSILSFQNEEFPIGISNADSEVTLDDNFSLKDAVDVAPSTESPPDRSVVEENIRLFPSPAPLGSVVSFDASPSSSDTGITEQLKLPSIEMALNALRKHVFKTMPIRLLCFKPDGSKLQITLIERGEIYAHIASNIVNSMDFLKFFVEPSQDLLERLHHFGRTLEETQQGAMELLISEYCEYAILSHTWLRGESREVTYDDWLRREFDPQQPGYRKLVNFCRTAWKDYGVAFGWMDTICINKDSSAELDESIRSMYKWYQGAHVCITYLAETKTLSDMPKDTWFTRGWTLQEFLAPSHLKFYNTDWDKLVESLESDKNNSIITKKIEEATTITADELKQHMSNIPISRRMQMAAKRQVTREEDSAYSLMGILDVSIATAYGEGAERAFSRLLQAVLNSTSHGIADIFNWPGRNHSQLSALLPSSLQDYLDRSSSLDPKNIMEIPIEPMMLTHLGLRITILLMPAISIENGSHLPWKNYHAIADISQHLRPSIFPDRPDFSGSYSVLDARTNRISKNNTWKNTKQLALGVLNVGGQHETIQVPRHCLAVVFKSIFDRLDKLATKSPVAFHLNNIRDPETSSNDYYYIERSELESHGMKLDTLIL